MIIIAVQLPIIMNILVPIGRGEIGPGGEKITPLNAILTMIFVKP